jgi:ribosome-binding factor A
VVDVARARRLAERIKVLVAESLDRVIKDPDLGMVTITDVRVTPDLQHAKVFYSVFGTAEQSAKSQELITRNTGRLRGEVGKHLQIRLTPTVEFIIDEVPVAAAQLNDLLAEARARDAQVAKLAAEAKFAGEKNPYKEPRANDEEASK